jgi:putative aldouronate transport system substrate-binding protein
MYENNGKIVAGEIEPGAKQALQVLSQWYKEEIIDPEFVVMTKWELLVEKFVASKAGFINRGFWEIIPVFGPAPFSNDDLKKVTPSAKVTFVGHPKGPNGDFGDTQGNPVSGSVLAFKKGLSPDVMAKYLELFDAVIFDKKFVELSIYGEEGTNFNKTAKGYEWIAPYNDQTERAKANIGLSFGKHMSDFDLEAQMTVTPEVKPLFDDAVSKAVGKYDILAPTLRPLKDQYSTDLGILSQKFYIDVITGKKSIEEFDNFVKEWKEKGGDKMIVESQKNYDEFFK